MAHYMMATQAIHKLGDISSDEPDLCVIHSEDEENYVGNWVTGFGFINVKFPKNTTRELTEEEKEKYHGMQIVISNSSNPIRTIYTKEMARVDTKESPVIFLPMDEVRKQQFRDKLTEYKGRMHPYCAPEMQMNTICKINVMERLLRDGQVNTWELSREMVETYGNIDVNEFNNACDIIDDYCKTGGANIHGGTGLKNPPVMSS